MKQILIFLLSLLFITSVIAGTDLYDKKTFFAKHLQQQIPEIDGVIDDECWRNANWDGDFLQYRPTEGVSPSQKTEFALLFDENYLYVAIKAYDTAPDSIVKRLTRRDQINGDKVGIQFDSYHNQRTAYVFQVSAAGVKSDYFMSNNGDNSDMNWDPIWYVKTSTDDKGWYAEMKIPLSQLRFNPEDNNTWGFQVERLIYRNDETVLWQPISRNASGWVHSLGLLIGLDNLKPKKTFDIVPYTLSSAETFKEQPGNPFATGNDYGFNAGVDGKIGITNYFTLDFTINPDFGQVEADPSQVNLSAFELFFPEKRPFFIEGGDLYSFRLGMGDGDLGSENLFYSRRIGRSPRYYPSVESEQYLDMPEYTPIIGALKITGRTNNGLSIGIMQSSTASQYARINDIDQMSKVMVEPFTNYIAGRIMQEMNDGNTTVGFMGTAVNRDLKVEHLDFLHKSAYTGGIDFMHFFNNRKNFITSSVFMSNVSGSENAILQTQLSPVRYFQRPDAQHLELDPNRTSLSGAGGNLQFGRISGKLRFVGAVFAKSPGLETNDIGYLRETDNLIQVLWVGYRINEPYGIIRSFSINCNQWYAMTFGLERTSLAGNFNTWLQFVNYWTFSSGVNYSHNPLSTSVLRGGPALALNSTTYSWASLGTDDRKKIRFSYVSTFQNSTENSQESLGNRLSISYRPHNALVVTLSPSYSQNKNQMQYVSTTINNDERVFILGNLEQTVAALSLRINYTITPELSLQFWGQPFIASGKFNEFKKVTDPRASSYYDRFNTFSDNQISYDNDSNLYNVSEQENGETDYRFHNPDFNFKEFLSNLVLRWEFRPGSTLFFVWSQTNNHFVRDGEFDFQNDISMLFSEKPHNVFMLKFSYRIGL